MASAARHRFGFPDTISQDSSKAPSPLRSAGALQIRGAIVRDNQAKIVIDAPDSLSNRRWMKQYKYRWRSKLEQTELWMVSYAVEVA